MEVDKNSIISNGAETLGICYIEKLSPKHQSVCVTVANLDKVIKALKNLGIEFVRFVIDDEMALLLTNKHKKVGFILAGFEED